MIKTVYICDGCGHREEFDGPQFAAKDPAKAAGWKTYRDKSGAWAQSCGKCSGGK